MRRALALLAAGLLLAGCASRGRLIQRRAQVRARDLVPETVAPLAPPRPDPVTVKVARGESLWVLARRHLGAGHRWQELAELNGMAEPWVLQPGQYLRLPDGVVPAPSPGAPPKPAPSAAPAPVQAQDEAARWGWKRQPNRAYTVGEKLTFAVQYGNITAGYAELSIDGVADVQGRPAFHVVGRAQTHPFFETFFKVRDRIESFIDVDYGFSVRYEKHLREGGYQADAAYLFDQRAGKIVEPAKGKEAPMPIGSQDVLSCFYWFRNLPLAVGDEAVIPVTADNMKSYELRVNVLKKERVSTLAGDFDCIMVQPHLTFQGVFQQKGDVFLWLTDDARRIPVKVRSKIVIGSINLNLQDAEWVQPLGN
jgi:LysM repeat protein